MNRIINLSRRLIFFPHKFESQINNFLSQKLSTTNAEFDTVYKFPYILPLAVLNKLKYYQTFLTVTTLPLSTLLYNVNLCDIEVVQYMAIFGMF